MTIHRRQFCEQSILAIAAAAATNSTVVSAVRANVPHLGNSNETLSHAIIGCRIRGKAHAEAFSKLPDVQVTHVCDPDRGLAESLADTVATSTGQRPEVVVDLRKVLDTKSVDTVSVCTPNHWHALATIWALQAGKDVYVEKPLSHTVEEGRQMIAAVAQSQRICQVGTQNRSHAGIRAAAEFVRSGKLGEVTLARTIVYGRRNSIGAKGEFEVPPGMDYNLWRGPATGNHLNRPQLHYDWHWVWDTGNGELGNNNIHYVDLVRWVAGLSGLGEAVLSIGGRFGYEDAGETPNTQMVVHRFGQLPVIQEVRGLPTGPFSPQVKDGWIVYGSEGCVSATSRFDLEGNLIETFPGTQENHFANFMDCVRNRTPEALAAPVHEGHQSTALCHIGNISHRVGQPARVNEIERQLESWSWNSEIEATFRKMVEHLVTNMVDLEKTPLTLGEWLRITEDGRFEDHWQANRLMSRSYRSPFELPIVAAEGS
jgi:predicted dehydrogenase